MKRTQNIILIVVCVLILVLAAGGNAVYDLVRERNLLSNESEASEENKKGEFSRSSVLTISPSHEILCEESKSHYIDVINNWFQFRGPQNASDSSTRFQFSGSVDDVTIFNMGGGHESVRSGQIVRNDNSYLQIITVSDHVSTYSLHKLTGVFTHSSSWGGNLDNGKEISFVASGVGFCRNI